MLLRLPRLLLLRVRNCRDDAEYAYLRQCWDVINRPKHQDLAWGARKGVMIEDVVNVMNFPYLGDLVIEE